MANIVKKDIIGQAELIALPQYGIKNVPARIDTGARTSSIWATNIVEDNGELSFQLFSPESPHYKDLTISTKQYSKVVVSSTIGKAQQRYKVKLKLLIKGRKINSSFTLSDRSKQVYPVLVGRNVLRRKFVVDVEEGQPATDRELSRSRELQSKLKE